MNRLHQSIQSNEGKLTATVKISPLSIFLFSAAFFTIFSFRINSHLKEEPAFDGDSVQSMRKRRWKRNYINIEDKYRRLCKQTYFWGSDTTGSTLLYDILTQSNDGVVGGFYSGDAIGKEPCAENYSEWKKWEILSKNSAVCRDVSSSNKSLPTHILNGCPTRKRMYDGNKIKKLGGDDATFIMIIRDPVDRLVSHLNDDVHIKHRRINIEDEAKALAKSQLSSKTRGASINILHDLAVQKLPLGLSRKSDVHVQQSLQGLALKNLLSVVKDPKKILIIPTESTLFDTQGVVNAIMDHVNGERWNVTKDGHSFKEGGSTPNYEYTPVSDETRDALRNVFRKDVQLLEKLVGRHFSWSSWARDNKGFDEYDVYDSTAWLTATPKSLDE